MRAERERARRGEGETPEEAAARRTGEGASRVRLDSASGELTGACVEESCRRLVDMAGVYGDEAARAGMDPETVVYRVQSYMPRPEGEPGAVCLATTFLMPGMVGDEYFMTRGHFHAKPDGPELEVCLSGEGALILMDESRRTWIEPLHPGAVVPVGPRTAHRAANTGSEPLVFISYWGSEIGHDYATIIREGFGARMMCVDGEPRLIPAS